MSRKAIAGIGLVLIVLGLLSLIFGGIPYTREETVINMGPVKLEAENQKKVSLPPVLGVIALGGGILLLLVSRKR